MRLTKINNLYQLSFCKKVILKTANDIGKPIKKIVLTHAHTDHLGAFDGLNQELEDIEALIPKRELKILLGKSTLEKEKENAYKRRYS